MAFRWNQEITDKCGVSRVSDQLWCIPSAVSPYAGNTAVHWNTEMQRSGLASKKALYARPPRPGTAPTPPLSKTTRTHVSASSSNSALVASSAPSSSGSHGSDSDDSGSELSFKSESGQDFAVEQHRPETAIDLDRLPDSCMKDRCLRPLHKLQEQSFMPSGSHADPMAEPPQLVWQNSGFMTPFTPGLFGPKQGQSRQISTAATGVSSVQGRGKQGACSALLCSVVSDYWATRDNWGGILHNVPFHPTSPDALVICLVMKALTATRF